MTGSELARAAMDAAVWVVPPGAATHATWQHPKAVVLRAHAKFRLLRPRPNEETFENPVFQLRREIDTIITVGGFFICVFSCFLISSVDSQDASLLR